jgi:hypothetical protein
MDPVTGTFTTMDTYGGSLSDPMSLHKYLFANSNPVRYSDPSGYSSSINEVNTVVGIITIIASASTVFVYNIIGDIYGADKTQPSYWICMVVAVIIVAILSYFTAGAFVEGIAICALGKILLGIMGLITANVCIKLSNEARVKGYELYGDLFEFSSVLLQTYAFNELIEGIAEGWSSLKEKISNAWPKNKKGYIYNGSSNNPSTDSNHSLWSPSDNPNSLWSKGKLKVHYDNHGSEFGASSSSQYSQMAFDFGTKQSDNIIQTTNGAYVYRFDPTSNEVFVGTISSGKIKTYYIWDGRSEDVVINYLKEQGLWF